MSLDLAFERLIAAPPERVFDAFTEPGGPARVLRHRTTPGWIVDSRCDLRVGGVWSVAFGPSPDELYHHRHVFEAIEPAAPDPHHLRPRRGSTARASTRRLEFTFEPRGGGTLMTMVQAGFPTEALRDEHTLGLPNAFAASSARSTTRP